MIEVAHIVARVTTDLTRFNAGMAAAEARAKSTTARMSLAGARMTKYLTLPLLGVSYAAVKSSVQFSDAMSKIENQAGFPHNKIKRLSRDLKELARDTTQGPVVAADTFYHVQSVLATAHVSYAKKLAITKEALKGAQIGFADAEDTASVLAGTMRAMQIPAKDANKVMGILNATVGAGNMRFQDLNRALGTGVVPVARNAGLKLIDVAASMTVFTDENQNAASSMTRLRTALMMMQSPSKKARENMLALGFTGAKIGRMIRKEGFLKTMEYIKASYDKFIKDHGGTASAKHAAFKHLATAFGGSKTASQVMVLLNNVEMLKQKYEQIRKTQGNFDKAVNRSNQTTGTKLRKSWSNVKDALIDLGDILAPTVLQLTGALARLSKWFSGLSPQTKDFIAKFMMAAMVLGPMLIVTSSLIKIFGNMYDVLKLLATGFRILAMAMMGNPIIAIIALIAIFALLMWKSKKFRETVFKVLREVRDFIFRVIGGIKDWIKNHWAIIILTLAAPWATLIVLIVKHWKKIKEALKAAWPYVKTALHWLLTMAVKLIVAFGKWFYNAGLGLGKQLAEGIKDGGKGLVSRMFKGSLNDLSHGALPGTGAVQGLGDSLGRSIWKQAGGSGRHQPRQHHRGTTHHGSGGYHPSSYEGGAHVNIEHMSVRSEEDPYIIASIWGRKMALGN